MSIYVQDASYEGSAVVSHIIRPNDAISISIGFVLFYLNVGTYPTRSTELLASGNPKSINKGVQIILERIKMDLAEVQTNLEPIRKLMALHINCSR